MKTSTEAFKLEKRNEDINIIINSIQSIKFKPNETTISLDLNNLIFKIVDNCHVTQSKAKEYLEIIQSRGLITIDRSVIYIKNQPEENKEVNKFFNELSGLVKR